MQEIKSMSYPPQLLKEVFYLWHIMFYNKSTSDWNDVKKILTKNLTQNLIHYDIDNCEEAACKVRKLIQNNPDFTVE